MVSAGGAETRKQPSLVSSVQACVQPLGFTTASHLATPPTSEGAMCLHSYCIDEETEVQRGAGAQTIRHSWN